MADGFFFANDPDLSKIKFQKSLGQALLQQGMGDPGSAPYGGLANALKEVAGAYLNNKSDKANSANYAKQLAALLGQEQPNAVNVTPQIQADASGTPQPNDPSLYNQPASTFQGGQLGMAPDKARLLANVLGGVDPDQGRQALQGIAMDQLQPKPLQFHPATDNAYDAAGNVVHQGAPPEVHPLVAGGTISLDGGKTWNKIPGYVEQQGAISDARAAGTAAHRAPPHGRAPKPGMPGFAPRTGPF